MTNPVLRMALACAGHGWPVFPCQPGQKTPATRHGYLDATTDPAQISAWFARHPDRNLAVATGAPGPDVLDIDHRGPEAGNGFPALARLQRRRAARRRRRQLRTPSGGLHLYFAGSQQRTGHLPASHVDFLAAGGYVLIPPSQSRTAAATSATTIPGGHGGLDWDAAARLLEPSRDPPARRRPASPAPQEQLDAPRPLGRRPARRQPQRRPVLGRQPRPGHRPGRRPQPPGRRRPPGRPRRPRDHPHPRLRPPHQPGQARVPGSPGRGGELT